MATIHKVEIINTKTYRVEMTLDNVEWDYVRDVIQSLHSTETIRITPKTHKEIL